MDNPFKEQYAMFSDILVDTGMSHVTVRRYMKLLSIKAVDKFAGVCLYPLDAASRIIEKSKEPRKVTGPLPCWTANQIAKMIHYAQSNGQVRPFQDLKRRIELQNLVIGAIGEAKIHPARMSSSSGARYSWDQVNLIAAKFSCILTEEHISII